MPDTHSPSPASSCSSLILAKTKRAELPQSFDLFRELLRSGWSADEFTLGSLVKACATLSDASLGQQLHAKSIRAGFCARARRFFDELPLADEADVPTWNSIISAYAFHGLYAECFLLFRAMLGPAQLAPTDATFAILISACSASKAIRFETVIHALILKGKMVDETKMHNSLFSISARWDHLEDAKKVFETMRVKIYFLGMLSSLGLNKMVTTRMQCLSSTG